MCSTSQPIFQTQTKDSWRIECNYDMMPSFCAYLGVEVPGSKVALLNWCPAHMSICLKVSHILFTCVCVSLYLSCFEGLIPLSNWHVDTVDMANSSLLRRRDGKATQMHCFLEAVLGLNFMNLPSMV